MNTSAIAMGAALVLAIGLVVSMAGLSLVIGAFEFLFGRPKLLFLRSQQGPRGFAFALKWNSAKEPAKMDIVRVKLYNPFGRPQQVDVSSMFAAQTSSFAQDLDLGPGMESLLKAEGFNNARIMVEVASLSDGVTHQFEMTGAKFKDKVSVATETAEEFNEAHKINKSKPLFEIPKRSFIAEELPDSDKVLKIATNPQFAGEFPADAGDAGPAQENFSITKVWIDPGCIVCDACEAIYPEVFEVTSDTCIIRPDAPLNDGLKIEEAADACPVEVIKFTKA